jgi:hypothetical protein
MSVTSNHNIEVNAETVLIVVTSTFVKPEEE